MRGPPGGPFLFQTSRATGHVDPSSDPFGATFSHKGRRIGEMGRGDQKLTQLPWKPKGTRRGMWATAMGPRAMSWASKTRKSLRSSPAR